MPDRDPKLPEKISDALNTIEDFTGVNVQKVTAHKVGAAYIAQQAAALTLLTIPLAVGGPPTLSQEQTRRPDESLPRLSQDINTLEGGYLFETQVTSGPMIQYLVPPADHVIIGKSRK